MGRASGAKKIGLTTTVPIEILFAAGYRPIDLNNSFIGSNEPERLVSQAEKAGLPRNLCTWIKGIYTAALEEPGLKEVLGIAEGDCSNTSALLELFQYAGLKVHTFSYPRERTQEVLNSRLKRLAEEFGVTFEEAEREFRALEEVRLLAAETDRLTWEEDLVSGFENHLYLIGCSDFESTPEKYQNKLKIFNQTAARRKPFSEKIRLGYLGVPPVFPDIYEYLEGLGARVVYNEVQREFTLVNPGKDLAGRYLEYSYPYDVYFRLKRIREESAKRRLDGYIHYTQSFCYRSLQDIIIKKEAGLPTLTLEGDRPGGLDERSKMRIRNFLELLEARR